MKIHNVSGTLEEAAKIVATMTPEEWHRLCDEMFQYEPSRPCAEKVPTVQPQRLLTSR